MPKHIPLCKTYFIRNFKDCPRPFSIVPTHPDVPCNRGGISCRQNLECPIAGIGAKRWTLDQDEDYELICNIYNHFIPEGKEDFVTEDILKYLQSNKHLEQLNGKIARNEGLAKSLANDKAVNMSVH